MPPDERDFTAARAQVRRPFFWDVARLRYLCEFAFEARDFAPLRNRFAAWPAKGRLPLAAELLFRIVKPIAAKPELKSKLNRRLIAQIQKPNGLQA
jgi:hypothetical protein